MREVRPKAPKGATRYFITHYSQYPNQKKVRRSNQVDRQIFSALGEKQLVRRGASLAEPRFSCQALVSYVYDTRKRGRPRSKTIHRWVEPRDLLRWTRASPCASLFLALQSEPLDKVRFSFGYPPAVAGGTNWFFSGSRTGNPGLRLTDAFSLL